MFHIIIDGDNISFDTFYDYILPGIKEKTQNNYFITLICQSNIVFKYVSNRQIDLSMKCCKTNKKNATDANIIFQAGKSVANGLNVIIISNDKIYQEISDNDNIEIVGYLYNVNETTYVKLKKSNILKALRNLKKKYGESYDVFVSDLQPFFCHYNIQQIRRYIESLPDIFLSSSDCVYVQDKQLLFTT